MSAAPDARVVLRPRTLLESCDLALRFLAVHARVVGIMVVVVAAPGYALTHALRAAFELEWSTVWTVTLALTALAEGPFTVLAGQLALRDDAGPWAALRAFAPRAAPFVLTSAASAALVAGAGLVLVVPGVLLAATWLFLPEAVLLEGAGRRAFGRASRVARDFQWRAVALVALLAATRGLGAAFADAVLRRSVGLVLDTRLPVESLWRDGGSAYALAGAWLSVPVCAAFRYAAYVDLRTRKEGWDLQRRFSVLGARLAGEGAGP